jgi:PHP family Zn ribbon phosphoesterase
MGHELTAYAGEPSYGGFLQALRNGAVDHTIEFYPQEGKCHYDGHLKCGVSQHPAVTLERGERCPVCGRKLTVGVLNRMESLARRPEAVVQREDGAYVDPSGRRPPFRRLVPLDEIIAEALGRGPATKGVRALYDLLIAGVGSELAILESATSDVIASAVDELHAANGSAGAARIADGVIRARLGDIDVQPGYDGVYGTVRVWPGA